MEISKSIGAQLAAASQLEKMGQFVEAAAIYRKLFDSDRNNRQVIARLLILYRKLKEYKKELSVLNDALAAYKRRQKIDRDEWIQSHPKAASVGKSMLRQLEKAGGAGAGLAGDPSVESWWKRKQIVTGRITGRKSKVIKLSRQSKKSVTEPPGIKPKAAAFKKQPASQRSQNLAKARQRQLKEDKLQQQPPSLFIILLTYRAPLPRIDAVMKQHMVYLTKHYDNGGFLISGRQIPRTGGVILARAANRQALEKIVSRDPFLKHKLATADIIEFSPSQMAQGLKKWLTPGPAK